MTNSAEEHGVRINVSQLQKSFGDNEVLKDVDLTIEKGQFIAIVGKSGSGKSTLLRLVAGLEQPSSGTLLFDDQTIKKTDASVTMMYQDSRLLPWKTVIDNVGLGLKGDWKDRALSVLQAVGLSEFQKEWPGTLSGGQKQRVALARALIREPDLLMLDEPLSALDALTRTEMQDLIEQIWRDNQFTSLLVTHDVREAVKLADRIVLIEDGEITLDLENPLPRPRDVTDERLVALEKQVTSRILEEEPSTSH
ncbi:ATP-binding cassette domain-containing protein [Geomicrobium sp. JCM 19055]|uniref:ATP-binding cassette domain-containing protein n=1 Tax=Geomicrobium sp. JCM 19055 TaxID=1460649 RepID=UPI00045ED30E|nr:ATP-binding cassette domain-containing protein [Geomicrobium sp. JCM 19055]GAJ98198.1 alkanesulfonates ABC transporter ATP-binding protein [Geomicrobium sp. JCM 19055]